MPDRIESPDPIIVIDTDEPIIRGKQETGQSFLCEQCGHMLIDQYFAYDYASIGLKCFKCEHVTFTPPSQPGEVFSRRTLVMPGHHGYRISSPIEKALGVAMVSDRELAVDPELTRPSLEKHPLDVTPAGMPALIASYETITGADYQEQVRILQRSPAKFKDKLLFAWCVSIVEERTAQNRFDLRDEQLAEATLYLATWKKHPRLPAVAHGFGKPGSFLHTAGLLIEAAIMAQANARIGLALEDLHGEPNPDLYIVGLREPRTYLEVKAPLHLQIVDDAADDRSIEATVKQIVDRSKSQINRHRPGLLVLFGTAPRANLRTDLRRYADNVVRRVGRSRSGLAGIHIVTLDRSAFRASGQGPDFEIAFNHSFVINPHFADENSFAYSEDDQLTVI